MEVPIVKEVVIIFALSIVVLLICHRLRLPSVVGFLMTGVLCGPHGFGLIHTLNDVQMLATVGIVLLLFTVGMEFSIQKIIKYKLYFFVGGLLQVCLTVLACFFLSKFLYQSSWNSALLLGFLIALSSTAIVLRALDEKGDSESPHGRLILGILIFQDIIAVPMMLLIPVLGGSSEGFEISNFLEFLQGIGVLALMTFLAFKLIPKLLYQVTLTRNRDLFLTTILTVCFAIAWVTSSVGLSLSLGAFLAGLIVSESEYSNEAIGNVLPFQELFTSFFFVSMGMLLDVEFIIEQPVLIVFVALLIIVLKTLLAGAAALILGLPLRTAVLAGLALSQIGEFSFVLALSGMKYELVSEYYYQLFLAVSLLTMAVTPLLISLSHILAGMFERLPLPQKMKTGYKFSTSESPLDKTQRHIIIIGYGLRGKHLARAAKSAGIPYFILEMNSDTVRVEKSRGEPIHYGDASHQSVLVHSGIKEALALAVVINDPTTTLRIVKAAKDLNPNVYVITRTRYFQEVPPMFQIGANDVVPDEFGSSLEIVTRILEKCNASQDLIMHLAGELRKEGYEALHWQSKEREVAKEHDLNLKEIRIQSFRLAENSIFSGKTMVDSQLRKMHGLTILQIKRNGETLHSIDGDTKLEGNDVITAAGAPADLAKAEYLFNPSSALPSKASPSTLEAT